MKFKIKQLFKKLPFFCEEKIVFGGHGPHDEGQQDPVLRWHGHHFKVKEVQFTTLFTQKTAKMTIQLTQRSKSIR